MRVQVTNPELRKRVAAFGTGFVRITGLKPGELNVLLLLNDSIGQHLRRISLSPMFTPS